jgi:aminoglycoside 6-adenylyltransferase
MSDAVIDRLVTWAEGEPNVRALILTSSRANPGSSLDCFSDYDVIVVATDILPFLNGTTWLQHFGAVLVLYRDPIRKEFGFERFALITQYEDGAKIDFTLWPVALLKQVAQLPALPEQLDVGYRVLLDKDSLAVGLQPPSYQAHVPAPPDQAEFENLIEEFFHESTYVAKHLWRGDLMPMKFSFDHQMKQVYLRRMLEWRMEIDHDWSARPGASGKGLKKFVRPEIWAELQNTYVGADINDNWDVLFRTISLFRKVATEVAQALGYCYPEQLDERVTKYLQNVKQMAR